MGICAIYTGLPATAPAGADELEPMVRTREHVEVPSAPANRTSLRAHEPTVSDGLRRQALGRLAVMELATWYAPAGQREVARTLAEHGRYFMFRQLPDDAMTRRLVQQQFQLAEVPQWGPSPVLACLFGAAPARLLGGGAHLALVSAGDVRGAASELAAHSPCADRYGADRVWRDFVATTAARGEALGIHWAYR
ncbi:MAG: hypothetical protein ACM31C_04995 [Acidobacteriota bacterium]